MKDTESTQAQAAHRRPKYLLVFLALTVFTALEVVIAFTSGASRTPLLLGASFLKAMLVILFYMHLRYDSRWFALVFFLPFVLVIPLLLVIGQ